MAIWQDAFTLTEANEATDLRSRCFRVVWRVANVWVVVGNSISFFTMDGTSALAHRLHLLGYAGIIIALAIYSVAIPLWYVTKEK